MNKIYDLNGIDGRHLDVYEDKVVLKIKPGVGSFLDGNARDGEKTIYFVDCVGIQFKESRGIMMGYLQFETSNAMANHDRNKYNNENTFIWDLTTKQTKQVIAEVADYCKKRIGEIKQNRHAVNTIIQSSSAEELKKFKELLDMGVITPEEFDAKKKQLLGL